MNESTVAKDLLGVILKCVLTYLCWCKKEQLESTHKICTLEGAQPSLLPVWPCCNSQQLQVIWRLTSSLYTRKNVITVANFVNMQLNLQVIWRLIWSVYIWKNTIITASSVTMLQQLPVIWRVISSLYTWKNATITAQIVNMLQQLQAIWRVISEESYQIHALERTQPSLPILWICSQNNKSSKDSYLPQTPTVSTLNLCLRTFKIVTFYLSNWVIQNLPIILLRNLNLSVFVEVFCMILDTYEVMTFLLLFLSMVEIYW